MLTSSYFYTHYLPHSVHIFPLEVCATLPELDRDVSGLRTWVTRAVTWSASDRDCLDFRRCTATVAFRAFQNKPRKIRERFEEHLGDFSEILLTGSGYTCMVLWTWYSTGSPRSIMLLGLQSCALNWRLRFTCFSLRPVQQCMKPINLWPGQSSLINLVIIGNTEHIDDEGPANWPD